MKKLLIITATLILSGWFCFAEMIPIGKIKILGPEGLNSEISTFCESDDEDIFYLTIKYYSDEFIFTLTRDQFESVHNNFKKAADLKFWPKTGKLDKEFYSFTINASKAVMKNREQNYETYNLPLFFHFVGQTARGKIIITEEQNEQGKELSQEEMQKMVSDFKDSLRRTPYFSKTLNFKGKSKSTIISSADKAISDNHIVPTIKIGIDDGFAIKGFAISNNQVQFINIRFNAKDEFLRVSVWNDSIYDSYRITDNIIDSIIASLEFDLN